MSYSVGEAAILTLIRTLSAYDTQNSSRQDWRILLSGKSDRYVVLRPGEWNNEQIAYAANLRSWLTVVEVFRPYRDDTKPVTIQDDVETIVALLETYPTLDGTAGVQEFSVVGGNEMQEVVLGSEKNQSLWVKWEVNCGWQEEKEITYAE